jgi:DNA-binding protein H-NS
MPRYSSIATIEARINALQVQAQRLEQSAMKGIRAASAVIGKYGLSLSDLRQALAMTSRRTGKSKLAGRRVPVKYRDDKGNAWTGRGRPPLWLVAAEKAGKNRDSFLVSATARKARATAKAKTKPKAKKPQPKAKRTQAKAAAPAT